jgi:hypothetical protein
MKKKKFTIPSHRKRWRWVVAFTALFVAILVADMVTGMNAVGATARMFWGLLRVPIFWFIRGADAFIIRIIGRRAWRGILALLSIGFGYLGRVFLREVHIEKVHSTREKFRRILECIRRWWIKLSLRQKLAVVAAAIALQVILLPTIHTYILLFPIGFMIPVMVRMGAKMYAWIGDTIFGKLYWTYCAPVHNAVGRFLERLPLVRQIRGAWRLFRLQYYTAWRLWRSDPRYRDESGKRWVSFIEPIRLWRKGKLNVYAGRPLLSGKRYSESVIQET